MRGRSKAAWVVVLCGWVSGCHKAPPAVSPPPPAPAAAQPNPAPTKPRARRTPPVVPAPAAAPAPAMQRSEAPARLTPLLSAEDKQRYSADVDQDLRSARLNASMAAKRSLSQEQRNTLEHIQNLIQQSEGLRKTDLVAAKGMSGKAAVLARDLAAATSK